MWHVLTLWAGASLLCDHHLHDTLQSGQLRNLNLHVWRWYTVGSRGSSLHVIFSLCALQTTKEILHVMGLFIFVTFFCGFCVDKVSLGGALTFLRKTVDRIINAKAFVSHKFIWELKHFMQIEDLHRDQSWISLHLSTFVLKLRHLHCMCMYVYVGLILCTQTCFNYTRTGRGGSLMMLIIAIYCIYKMLFRILKDTLHDN